MPSPARSRNERAGDQASRDLVSRVGLGQTLFVEAGAGTGKTTQLVDRIANLVLRQDVRLVNIAAITFTEAAAAELQARIRVRFEQEVAAATDPTTVQRALDAIKDADRTAISTLHGFASRLLDEFAVEAGIPPRVRVLDEVSSQLAHEDRWSRFVDRVYDDPALETVLTRAALLGVAFEPQYPGHATLKDVAAELDQHWDRLGPLANEVPAPIRPVDFGPFDEAVAAVVALPDGCTDPGDKFLGHLTGTLIPAMTALVEIDDPDRKLRALAAQRSAVKKWGPERGGKDAAWGGSCKDAKANVTVVNDALDAVFGVAADEVLRHLLVLIAGEVLAAARDRQAEGGLEFHDLLVLARDMLRESTLARERLHERYTHILLDEFQDTDPLQIELALLIAASIAGGEPGHWETMTVDEGRLFFVGDPKQSIYRFRRADIALFLRARERFGPGGTWVRLTTNFRTVEPIVAWVNALFGAEMAEAAGEKQPAYEPLSAWRAADTDADHRPVLLGGPHPDPKVRAGSLRETEAADVAATIASIAAAPDQWPVFVGGAWRPARLSDVTVLVPTRTSLPYLRDALAAAGVPYRLATGTLVYDTQEVRDVLAAVRAVDDPTDELSLVAALRSPLYACSDVDLFTYRAAGGQWDLRRDPVEAVAADHPVRAAMVHLRALWKLRWWSSPSALLGRLLADRQAFLLAFGDPRPAEVWRRLRFILDQARAFEEAGGGDVRAFLDWADLQSADGARVHEPLLPETDDDAVSILTIHGAKGLEFPITVLSGMTTKPGAARSGVNLVWGDDRLEVSLGKGKATANHEPRADLELEMDTYEKVRLLYVAATRARDHLIVSCHHKAGAADTYAGRMWTHFADRPELCHARPVAPAAAPADEPAAVAVPAEADDRAGWITRRARLLDPQRVPRVVSATTIAREAAPVADADLADDDPPAHDDDSPVPMRRRGRAGSAIGRAVHATLEVIDFGDPHDLDAQVRRQCDVEAIPDLVATVASMVRSALASEAVGLAASSIHHREIYVAAPLGDRMVEGYVDLLIETDEGLVIVDYKTDSASSEAEIDAKLAAYELQGASYAVALETVTGLPVVDCRFVFCRSRGAIERSVTDLPGAMARVRAAVGASA